MKASEPLGTFGSNHGKTPKESNGETHIELRADHSIKKKSPHAECV